MKKTLALLFVLTSLLLSATPAQEEDVSKTFSVQPGGRLVLDIKAEEIVITTEATTTVTVLAEYVPERYKNALKMEQKGNDVYVTYRPARNRQIDTRFSITIPVEYNVEAEYAGGRFDIGETLKGTLSLNTGGGSVDVGTISGRTAIESGGGSIEAKELESDAEIKTGGGNVRVRSIGGVADLSSGGGSVHVEKVGKDLKLETGGGNVRVESVGGEAEVRSGGGNVKVGPVAKASRMRTGGGNLEVAGGEGRSTIASGGGNITLEAMSGSVDVTTGGGGVTVSLTPKGSDDSNVYSKGGDITFYLPSDAKVTVDATLNARRWERKKYRIRSDFETKDLTQDEDGNAHATVMLNGGGPLITLETTDGDIDIKRMR